MQPLISIPAHDVDVAGMGLALDLPRAWLNEQLADAELGAAGDGRLDARLSRSGKADIVVRGKVTARVVAQCARCLEPTEIAVAGELGLLLKPRPAAPPGRGSAGSGASRASKTGSRTGKAGGEPAKAAKAASAKKPRPSRREREDEYEFRSEEAEEDSYDGERVVLDDFVREAILLELPSSPLCSDGCAGIEAAEVGSMRGALKVHPSVEASAPAARPNPFEALRHLMTGESPGDEVARRPSPAEVRKVARKKSKESPKLRSSLAKRTKK